MFVDSYERARPNLCGMFEAERGLVLLEARAEGLTGLGRVDLGKPHLDQPAAGVPVSASETKPVSVSIRITAGSSAPLAKPMT